MLSSVVEPCATQMVAPLRSFTLLMPARLADDEALAVIEHRQHSLDAGAVVAVEGPGEAVREHVDAAGGQRREAVAQTERRKLDLLGIAEHGGGDRVAEIDVETAIIALRVFGRETRRVRRDAAAQDTARFDVFQGAGGCRGTCSANAPTATGRPQRGRTIRT